MKAITLTQPWATLVAVGAKKIETRSWATKYRGSLAIHAAAGLGPGGRQAYFNQCYQSPFLQALEPFMTTTREIAGDAIPHVDAGLLPRGAIVAVCWLFDCVPTKTTFPGWWRMQYPATDDAVQWRMTEQERAFGDYLDGRYAWLLGEIWQLPEPIPAKGQLGLWEWQPPEGFER